MSVFASSAGRGQGRERGANTAKMARVRGALEHCSLYLGLAIYIALGAKVTYRRRYSEYEIMVLIKISLLSRIE